LTRDIDSPSRIVLEPKLRAPAPRAEQLVRPGLLERLGTTLGCKVTVLSAPAGYGKTTLLAQWLQADSAGSSFAWVSLDEQDNDPVRMWRHIVEAVRRVSPEEVGFGSSFLAALSFAGKNLIEVALPLLINEFDELPHRVEVVLDDYQSVTEDASNESLTYFLNHLPDNVHLVLASRSDPPLPLGRLRASGEMNEIRMEQLAFSEEEAEHLLNEKMSLDISADDISVLLERTEGWPAGIYLASLSLQRREDKHAYIESFRGSNRYILELLGEEVLAGLPEEVREFLLMTSVLRRMTGPLCDAVVGREGSGKLLRELARSNLFVIPLDERGEWYRYHHLFADLLYYELKRSRPELVSVLHVRASVWSEGAGFFEGAIRQAIAATDYERAAALIARYWYEYVAIGHFATVERWLGSLPESLVTQDAALVLGKAWLSALSGKRDETEHLLNLAESIPHEGSLPDGTASVESGVAIIRAIFGFGGVKNMLEAARRAAALEPGRSSPQSAMVALGLGMSWYYSGDIVRARRVLQDGLRRTTGNHGVLRIGMLCFLSFVAADEGHLEEAESLAREAGAVVERFRLQGIPQGTLAPIALGRVLAKRGSLAEAQTELESALSERRKLPGLSTWPTLVGLLALAQVRSASGDRAGARAILAEARTLLEPFADDAGIFPELLERQEHELRKRKPREGQLDGEITGRELEVLRLLTSELSNHQIAQRRYVAPSTVRTQLKSIYRKLGVSSREGAVEEARIRGLI
jgi:LuxR family transcriptional regulator, maltose regulon positive regulatory protein